MGCSHIKMEKYGHLKVKELREELKKRKAKVSGVKKDLTDRLIYLDRNNNKNFEDEKENTDENFSENNVGFSWPPDLAFKSVRNSSVLPNIDIVNVQEYFESVYSYKEGRTTCQMIHRKGYGMMDQNFLAALQEYQAGDIYYYHGQVNSEYTKRLTYFIKLVVHQNGNIMESSCECVAGKGLHAVCKHISVVCYALLRFSDRGTWQIRKTCTELKQTWHMPKRVKIDVSPQKAQNLSFHIPEYNITKRKRNNLCYDPRPVLSRNLPGFNDFVRNMTINFCLTSKKQLGYCGILDCASMKGIVHDHDYLLRQLNHQMIMNLIQAYHADRIGIERRTIKQSNCSEWHQVRSCIVTASNVGTIVLMTERKNKEAFAEQLVNPKSIYSPALSWGKKYESIALRAYEERSHNIVKKCGLFISETHPFIGGSPDGLIAVMTVLEIKCPYSIRNDKISTKNLNYLIERDGKLYLRENSHYYYQVQTEMFVTGRQFCDFIVWTTCDMVYLSVNRNDSVIQNVIISKVKDFFENYMIQALVKKYYPSL